MKLKNRSWPKGYQALQRLGMIATLALFAPRAQSQTSSSTLKFDVGPNYVDQSGSSCRAESHNAEKAVNHYAGQVNVQGSSTTRVYCPVQRRNTTFYGVSGGLESQSARLDQTGLRVFLHGASVLGTQSCTAFRKNLDTGAVHYGSTKWLCSTIGGCTTDPGVAYEGDNSLELSIPNNASKTVNHGFFCDLRGPSGQVWYSRSIIKPNP